MENLAISITDLRYAYPNGGLALKGVSFQIQQGECVGLIGPNGAGKTTLLFHLNGIFQSRNGTVKILGNKVCKDSVKHIRKEVGLVFQDPDDQLFMPTVFDDVAFGPINLGYDKVKVQQRVDQALCWMGMQGFDKRSPHQLSIGQKKRIAIASVLSMDPKILVLDEPTSNLDPRGKWDLIELLQDLPMTKVIASHDMEMIQSLCQRTLIMANGQITADDLTEIILSDNQLLRQYDLAR
ncbi:MAG: ABC transporter ATP-binding protein [Chloroflexota bacterium]|nr:ABC transporter ATP-binding protein [Chloroflexota bacterium]